MGERSPLHITPADTGSASVDPPVAEDDDQSAVTVMLAATRQLLWISTPAEAQAVAIELVRALGGVVVSADTTEGEVLPVDVSFGIGPPLLVWADDLSVARMLLARHLPVFLRDAYRALEMADQTQRFAEDVAIDALTGLSNRRMVGRALGRLHPGDVVIMLDLDDFKRLNDTLGHTAGDAVLSAFGKTIADNIRARDQAGRYGGEEFVVIMVDSTGDDDAEIFLDRLRTQWQQSRPHPVSFSAGIARADDDAIRTLQAADDAMSAAKRLGRDRWVHSDPGSPTPEG